jgi:phage terminase small subunit
MTKHKAQAIPFKPRREAPTPPAHLGRDAAAWWQKTQIDFDLEDHHVLILTQAAGCLDRLTECRNVLAVEGLTTVDRFEQVKPHPLVTVELAQKALFARLVRELGLDIQDVATPRPAALG